jgi:hypothetical protein
VLATRKKQISFASMTIRNIHFFQINNIPERKEENRLRATQREANVKRVIEKNRKNEQLHFLKE